MSENHLRSVLGMLAAAWLLAIPANAMTRIGIITDTHVGSPKALDRLEATYRLLLSHGVTNIFNLGDIADRHVDEWYRQYAEMRSRVYPNGVNEVFVYHNHDRMGYRSTAKDEDQRLAEAFAAVQRKLGAKNGRYHSFKLEGFTFLVYPQGVDYRRMEREIRESVAADPGKPVFVLDHMPPLGTSAGSEHHFSANPRTAAIFRKYPQIVALTGHVHGSVKHEGKIWQREFTAIGFGTTKNPAAPGADYHIAIMELDPQKAVIRRYSLATGKEFRADDPWTLTFPFDPLHPRYSHEVRAKNTPQPAFASGAKLDVQPDHVHLGGLVVSFPGTQNPDWTSHYRVSVEDDRHDHSHPRSAVSVGSGYFAVPEEKRPASFATELDPGLFTPGEKVTVSVTPSGFFGNDGNPISAEAVMTNGTESGWVTVFDDLPQGAKRDAFVPCGTFRFPKEVWDAPPGSSYRFVFELSVKQFDAPGLLEIVTAKRCQFIGKIRLEPGNWTRRFSITRPRPDDPGPWVLHLFGGTNLVQFHSFRIQRRQIGDFDYRVFTPKQPLVPSKADPSQVGDHYNDHFQVIWDPVRKLYYAFWTQATREGAVDMHVVFSKSADRGRSWTPPRTIAGCERASDPKPRACWQQPMLAKSGRLYCLWNQQANAEALHHGIVCGAYSDDAGETWSESEANHSIPRQLRDDPSGKSLPNWCNWQRPLRLGKDGRFLVGCTRHVKAPDLKFAPNRPLGSWVEFWQYENIDDNPEIRDIRISVLSGGERSLSVAVPGTDRFCCEEASLAKLPDGRLFALMRTRARHPFWAQSFDDGHTWSEPRPLKDAQGKEYLHPNSPCPMYALHGPEASDGEVFALVHNAYDDSIPPLGRQERGPLYRLRGTFDPNGDQPVKFGAPEPFLMLKEGNACYSSYTEADGETVLWFGLQKYRLVGKTIERAH